MDAACLWEERTGEQHWPRACRRPENRREPKREPLPASVRWLPLVDVPEAMPARRLTKPNAAAGLLLFADNTTGEDLRSIKCEALAIASIYAW